MINESTTSPKKVKRKRGRPKKNEVISKKAEKCCQKKNDEEIILHLPIKMKEIYNDSTTENESNIFTLDEMSEYAPNSENISNKKLLDEIKKKIK